MTDIITEVSKELQEKSAFVCTSCGHPHEIAKVREQVLGKVDSAYHDRFSDAVAEEGEKSAFVCEGCGKKQSFLKKLLH